MQLSIVSLGDDGTMDHGWLGRLSYVVPCHSNSMMIATVAGLLRPVESPLDGQTGHDGGVQMGWWNARGYEDAFQGGEDPAISPKPKV